MKYLNIRTIGLLLISTLIFQCKKKDVDPTPTSNTNIVSFTDPFDDTDTSFIDIGEVSVDLIEDTLIAYMQMKLLPNQLTFNHSYLDLNALNYSWGIIFDLDNDQTYSKNDLEIQIAKWKFTDAEITADILEQTQENIWKRDASSSKNIADIELCDIDNNVFIIKVPISLHDDLKQITTTTNIIFQTKFSNGIISYTDRYPN